MSVAIGPRQAAFCATLVDELVLGGVRHCVICPGSRSTPLTLAASASSLSIHVRLDERSAGFFALGLARITSRPVLIVVTSGTAAAELLPAVVEAHLDRIPLIVATADRPPELQGVGSAQTIDQDDLYGSHATSLARMGPCHAWPEEQWRPLASRAVIVAEGLDGLGGPVHLNLPFVEPLVADPGPIPPPSEPDRPHYSVHRARGATVSLPQVGSRGVVIAGLGCGDPRSVVESAERLGWPIFADPRSGCRGASPAIVASADPILRSGEVVERVIPETIVLLGAPPASKVVSEWIVGIASKGASILCLGSEGPRRHPTQVPATFLMGRADALFDQISRDVEPAPPSWLQAWMGLEGAAGAAIDAALGDGVLCEPSLARTVMATLDDVVVVSSSSMPIRDLEWFGGARAGSPLVVANRGANGIDGVVSTALGVASGSDLPAVALVGDLAFFHDVSALVDGLGEGRGLVIVVLDNDGGGIFSFLPQRDALSSARFEELFATPRSSSVAGVARGFGCHVIEVGTHEELSEALAETVGVVGVHVVVAAMPSRDYNVQRHELITQAVERATRDVAI
jgi:2-succinyl-5-enolpyruvyl-6-hydroxy-3-cyclohexene-1-carboxylate synthase